MHRRRHCDRFLRIIFSQHHVSLRGLAKVAVRALRGVTLFRREGRGVDDFVEIKRREIVLRCP